MKELQVNTKFVNNLQLEWSEGHVGKQCTQLRTTPNSEWFKEKMLLAQDQVAGVALDEEHLAFLVDTRESIDSGRDAQALTTTVIY
nr:hypothetical protein [Tanacetum cinerariifolium]